MFERYVVLVCPWQNNISLEASHLNTFRCSLGRSTVSVVHAATQRDLVNAAGDIAVANEYIGFHHC